MARIPDLQPDEMNAAQKRLFDEIAAPRHGVVRGPFPIWLRNPDLIDKANQLGNLLREGTSVPKRLSELAILCTARHWTAQYEWFAHRGFAEQEGISPEAIEAIRTRGQPLFERDDERMVYQLCTQIYAGGTVADQAYEDAIAVLGQMAVIELVAIAGFYSMVAMTLNVFDAPLPGDADPPLAD